MIIEGSVHVPERGGDLSQAVGIVGCRRVYESYHEAYRGIFCSIQGRWGWLGVGRLRIKQFALA